jgi:hypothetical protein
MALCPRENVLEEGQAALAVENSSSVPVEDSRMRKSTDYRSIWFAGGFHHEPGTGLGAVGAGNNLDLAL